MDLPEQAAPPQRSLLTCSKWKASNLNSPTNYFAAPPISKLTGRVKDPIQEDPKLPMYVYAFKELNGCLSQRGRSGNGAICMLLSPRRKRAQPD